MRILAIQLDVAKYHFLFSQGAVAFQTLDLFNSPRIKGVNLRIEKYVVKNWSCLALVKINLTKHGLIEDLENA